MNLNEKIKYASQLVNYLKINRYIQIEDISKNSEINSAVKLYENEESVRELVDAMLTDIAVVNATNEIIAYEPIVGKASTNTLGEALRELSLPKGSAEKKNLKYYQLFAQIAGIVLPLLLFTQESNSGNLIEEVTTTTAWLNTIKFDVLEKFNDAKSKELLTFINELGSQQNNQSKRKDLKILDKVLQKWFVDTKYVTCDDRQNIYPTQYFKFEMERILENYDSEYSKVMNEMTAKLLNVGQENDEESVKNV